ncbi:uncharacterized protein G2W53_004811 [Senna tora]|uniref:Uncharacterized protein n=1 Tax=Senna tora TaxID=362788 RepID=A0A834XBU6_9FABA|nr:uncharacterized protein G2W53_004811 [Senna tora]
MICDFVFLIIILDPHREEGSIGLMDSISQAVYDGARSVYGDPLQQRRRRQDTAAAAEATSQPPGAFSLRHKTTRYALPFSHKHDSLLLFMLGNFHASVAVET